MTRYFEGLFLALALGVMGCSEPVAPESEPECLSNADCNDGDPCTSDWCCPDFSASCERGTCGSTVEHDGWPCPTQGAVYDGICISGVCSENPCDDGDPCTHDSYPPPCEHLPRTSCLFCSNQDAGACELDGVPGICVDGDCVADPCEDGGAYCDDGNRCTDDSCNPVSQECFNVRQCSTSTGPTGECTYVASYDWDRCHCEHAYEPNGTACETGTSPFVCFGQCDGSGRCVCP